jgi:UDP-N-acetylmuramoyl-tripeptide--D-alanyl-D-alanine ligase
MKIDSLYKLFLQHPSVQTDSRKVKEGDIFFALKGPNFNGNAYAKQSLDSGAAYAIVDEPSAKFDDRTILTDDVLKTLQQLARHHRLQFKIPFIAITGSNGKTTTKELIHAVLSSTFKTYTTQGNLNNHIGIPLTLLQIKQDAEMAVIEMGANHRGEIAGYCQYTLPTHGIITNCGKAHLEGFGGIEGVRKGKGELYDFLRETGGTVFAMWDYSYLREMSKGIGNIIKYGTSDADYTGVVSQAEPFLNVDLENGMSIHEIKTQLVGDYNLPNVLVAVAVGRYFNVTEEKIRQSLEQYAPSNSRSQLITWKNNHIILDAYNANPSSMKLAIENFVHLHADNKFLLLGGMAELGKESIKEHRLIVELIKQHEWKDVALVGGDFDKIDHPFKKFSNSLEAGKWLRQLQLSNAYLLVKGSRSMQMERVLED